jgi:D-alanine-D-alanine ligase
VAVKVVVVFGGNSPEHEISLAGANSVLEHAASLGWDVLPVGVSKDGHWLVGASALDCLWQAADPDLLPRASRTRDIASRPDENVEVFAGPPPASVFGGYALALPVCHGRWGEDGTLQGLLQCYGMSIVGCDVASSAICFDKHLTRSVLMAQGLPVAKGVRVRQRDYDKDPDAVLQDAVGVDDGPWFVKPGRAGSSLGIGVAASSGELQSALAEAFRFDTTALIEEFVPHRELVVGVVGVDELLVSPAGECLPIGDLYTYEEKYHLGNPRFTCPAQLDGELATRIRELATDAFRALGCSVFARVDLFVDQRTGRLLVNEVNTIPGMTESSVFPKVMEATGYRYAELLTELCRLTSSV